MAVTVVLKRKVTPVLSAACAKFCVASSGSSIYPPFGVKIAPSESLASSQKAPSANNFGGQYLPTSIPFTFFASSSELHTLNGTPTASNNSDVFSPEITGASSITTPTSIICE